MSESISRTRKSIWIAVIALIVLSNYLAYALPIVPAVPKEMVLGSLFDFLIVIPVITYFFIIRKRYSLKHLFPVVIAGYIAARFIIPSDYFQSFSFVTYILIAGELAFLCLELFILYKIARALPKIIRCYKQYKNEYPSFSFAIDKAFDTALKRNTVVNVIVSECKLLYYALFSWRTKMSESEYVFSYHKKTGAIPFYIMLIHAILIESIGFHYLLHQWNPVLAWILLILNIYGILYFLAEIQAIRTNPYIMTETEMIIQVGFGRKIVVPFSQMEEITFYRGEALTKEEEKEVFEATVMEFIKEPATFEIKLKEPLTAQLLYGFTKKVNCVHVNVDDERKFYEAIVEKIEQDR
ncbi:hypothetical protein H9I32_12200 [Bacillus sp. Xin]|uniref:hypothetical protein n=1 Tax=unclassified Bacillus (in: firmicutes) TaxID=185979 RepID=UPI001571F9CA|nr:MULTISPECIES: hypothetical protein [unclassified Bacillus (in: firmicutes)]MBC6973111.1 hypothetical protein [Bacillus sp. Xin]NSW36301.1 hypothetical protein [Bacillus sp. Xin1]